MLAVRCLIKGCEHARFFNIAESIVEIDISFNAESFIEGLVFSKLDKDLILFSN